MNLKQRILSYFLILSYTLSFSHSLIPHSDALINGEHIHDLCHSHYHPHEASLESNTENAINHEDHFDESVFDYLICIFSDLEHGESECAMEDETPSQEVNVSFLFVNIFYAVINFHDIDVILEQKNKEYDISNEIIYSSPHYSSLQLRGPPELS